MTLVGPNWAPGEKTYTMAFPGWPFAFRAPDNWGCMRGTIDTIPDARAWSCVNEQSQGTRQRLHVMLLDCPTTCTKAEREAQDALWFDTPGQRQVFDGTTVYREKARKDRGLYAMDVSHYFGPTPGGPLRWQVGIYFESPDETKATLYKVVNDILSQTP